MFFFVVVIWLASYALRQKIVIRRASIRYCVGGGGIGRQWHKAESEIQAAESRAICGILYSEDIWPIYRGVESAYFVRHSTAIIRCVLPIYIYILRGE